MDTINDPDFDTALLTAAFRIAHDEGWRHVNVVKAARAAGLPLADARVRFPSRVSILLRFGQMADQAALEGAPAEGPVRDRLFDLLMRRFDALQAQRAGVLALMRALPLEPPLAFVLACATRRSMRWMLQATGITATGLRGELEVKGLVAVWLWVLRAWERDDSADLSGTMAALDTALERAEQVAGLLRRSDREPAAMPAIDVPDLPAEPEGEPA